jgi:hypothetical protein
MTINIEELWEHFGRKKDNKRGMRKKKAELPDKSEET